MNLERLDKIISLQFNISRSVARKSVFSGRVTVDGQVLRDPSLRLDPDVSDICYDGQAVEYKKYIYIVMNKPKGVLSASNDKKRETVVDLVPEALRRKDLFPVGRLDRDTTGLLIITDDGDFAHNAISPKKKVKKTYIAELDGAVTDQMVKIFAQGLTLADGTACAPAELEKVSENSAKITITEGKYHQIKRMFGVVGLGVNGLRRVSFGGLALPENLSEGECRELTAEEFNSIIDK